MRRIEVDHHFHRSLHDFSESIEHALTAILLIALGSVLPLLLADLEPIHIVMAIVLLVVIRPLSGWIPAIQPTSNVVGRDAWALELG